MVAKADGMQAAIADGAKEEAREKIADLRKMAEDLDNEIAKTQKRIDDLQEKLKDPKFSPEDISKILNELGQQQSILDTLKSHKDNLIAQADEIEDRLNSSEDPNEILGMLEEAGNLVDSLNKILNEDLPDINHDLNNLEIELENLDQKKMLEDA